MKREARRNDGFYLGKSYALVAQFDCVESQS